MSTISVLFPTKNGEQYISESISSISAQSFEDFEFLILDDGSEDNTWELLQGCASLDRRIRLFRNKDSVGVAAGLQMLFEKSCSPYIARMDSDDISHARRFSMQLQYMKENDLDVCGTWVTVFGDGRNVLRRHPVTDEEIKAVLAFVAPFTHPSVMMRRGVLEKHPYMVVDRSVTPVLEDNDLWVRMANDVRMGNVPYPLLMYREHGDQVSSENFEQFWRAAGEIGLAYLQGVFGISPTPREREVHVGVRYPLPPDNVKVMDETEVWLTKVRRLFAGRPSAQRVVAEQWYRYSIKCASLGFGVYRRFRKSPLYRYGRFSGWQRVAVAVLCLLRVRYNSVVYRFLVRWSPAGRL